MSQTVRITIGWDSQDPACAGWAYWVHSLTESGAIDDILDTGAIPGMAMYLTHRSAVLGAAIQAPGLRTRFRGSLSSTKGICEGPTLADCIRWLDEHQPSGIQLLGQVGDSEHGRHVETFADGATLGAPGEGLIPGVSDWAETLASALDWTGGRAEGWSIELPR